MDPQETRKHLSQKKGLALYKNKELKYIEEPLGYASYCGEIEHHEKEPKTHWSDRIKCNICGKEFTRSARSAHKQTVYHKLHLKFHKKISNLMINE